MLTANSPPLRITTRPYEPRIWGFAWLICVGVMIKYRVRPDSVAHVNRHRTVSATPFVKGMQRMMDSWMYRPVATGPLKDWVECLLDERPLRTDAIFCSAPVREKWTEHITGHRQWASHLWNVLMFQNWLDGSRKA